MFSLLKIIVVSIILACGFSWIISLEQLMRERPWNDVESHKELSDLNPTLAKSVIIVAYLVTGTVGIAIAVGLLNLIINL